MSDKRQEQEPFSEEDLAAADGEPLPDRDVMSIIAPPEATLPIEPSS
jgi:hypothetical protein